MARTLHGPAKGRARSGPESSATGRWRSLPARAGRLGRRRPYLAGLAGVSSVIVALSVMLSVLSWSSLSRENSSAQTEQSSRLEANAWERPRSSEGPSTGGAAAGDAEPTDLPEAAPERYRTAAAGDNASTPPENTAQGRRRSMHGRIVGAWEGVSAPPGDTLGLAQWISFSEDGTVEILQAGQLAKGSWRLAPAGGDRRQLRVRYRFYRGGRPYSAYERRFFRVRFTEGGASLTGGASRGAADAQLLLSLGGTGTFRYRPSK